MAHYYMSKVLSTLYNGGATLVQRYTFNVNDLPTVLTIFQRWTNVILLSGSRTHALTHAHTHVFLKIIDIFLHSEIERIWVDRPCIDYISMRLGQYVGTTRSNVNMAHYYMSKVLSTLYNGGATLVQRYTLNVNDPPTVLTIFQRWSNVILLSGSRTHARIHTRKYSSKL